MDKDWEAIREQAGKYAEDNMYNGLNCAESVFDACIRSGALDLSLDAVAYMSGFGGGVGASGYTCGALTAAVLANCVVHGRKNPAAIAKDVRGNELKERIYKRYNNLAAAFVSAAGSGLCREIVGQFPDGYKDPDSRPNCVRICGEAAKIAVDFLQIEEDEVEDFAYDWSVIGIKGWTER
ncbi:MAG: C-GCAxxG-C-C family protein [Clostridiales bacterium]|nr:C-GCAxxG-C-C family protein [Clostridiales bacterium]